jgi:hypothetical protein
MIAISRGHRMFPVRIERSALRLAACLLVRTVLEPEDKEQPSAGSYEADRFCMALLPTCIRYTGSPNPLVAEMQDRSNDFVTFVL